MRLDELDDDRCTWCGAPLDDQRRLGRQFCSKRCLNASCYDLERKARAEERKGRVCPQCSNPFDAVRMDQVYCSRRCRRAAGNERQWGRRSCAQCAVTYVPSREDQRFCGCRCAALARPEHLQLMWDRRDQWRDIKQDD